MDDDEAVLVEITDTGIRVEVIGMDESAASALLYRTADELAKAARNGMN